MWVAGATAERRARDRSLAVLSDLVRDYEAVHGVITDDEIAEQAQRDCVAAAVSRRRPGEPGECLDEPR